MAREAVPLSQRVQLTLMFPLLEPLEKSLHQITTLWASMRSGVSHPCDYRSHPSAKHNCVTAVQKFLRLSTQPALKCQWDRLTSRRRKSEAEIS